MKEKIREDYKKGLSINKLCKKYNIGVVKVSNIILDIKRSKSESLILSNKLNPIKHTEETKKKMSKKRKEWLKNNPDKHPWKNNDKFISKPCEHLKKILKENNIKYEEELTPLKDKNYSIDIVLLNKGIGLEVNGNQHYNKDKSLKEYYQIRKNEIEKNGWKLLDIHYSLVYKEDFILELISYIENNKDINLDFNLPNKKINKCVDCGVEIYKESKRCIKCIGLSRRKVERPTQQQLLEEIKKLGYVGTGKKYGVSDNAIRKWIKK